MKKLLIASAFILIGQAHAADSGFYLTAGLGVSVNGYKQEDAKSIATTAISAGYSSVRVELDKAAGASKLGLGYQINPYVAIDVAFMNLGTFEHKFTTTGPSGTGTIKDSFFGTAVSIIGTMPTTEKNSVFVKLGSLSLKNKVEGKFCVSATCASTSMDQKSTVPLFGIGGNTEFSERWGITGEWNHAPVKYDDGSNRNFNLSLISGRYKF